MPVKEFKLRPTEMSRPVMEYLEKKGCIILFGPGRHETTNLAPEADHDIILYTSDPAYGSHKTMAVTINASKFSNFGSHCDCEDFILLGESDTKPLYIVIALMNHDAFLQKEAEGTLCEEDFILLKCKFNDPECSFFTMLKNIPHGECTLKGEGRSPSFYVTEPSAMTTKFLWDKYDFSIIE